jgi:hypothetical protein
MTNTAEPIGPRALLEPVTDNVGGKALDPSAASLPTYLTGETHHGQPGSVMPLLARTEPTTRST